MKPLFACFLALFTACSALGADKPNVVFILSEDNSVHYLDHFFPGGADTPNIKKMAAHGVTFDHAYSNAPVCSVARTSLITSCYAPRIGTQYHRRSKMAPMPDGLRMFPAYLRDAGYYTTNNSKEDYNAIKSKDVWDESSNKAHWRQRAQSQPFFHKVTFKDTHESSLHFKGGAMAAQKTTHDPAEVYLPSYLPDTPTVRYTFARYLDNIQKIDAHVGKVLADLEADGLLEDTFVFYFGDHGGVLPRSKGYAFDSGLHIPLVVRVPANFKHLVKAENGSREKGFVEFVDFGATALNLTGAKIPDGIDGKPFLGKGASTRQFTFNYADRFDEKYDQVRWLRKGKFSYQRNYQPFNFDGLQNDYRYFQLAFTEWRDLHKAGKLNAIQSQFFGPRPAEALYDLELDPHEVNNLAKDPAHAKTLAELRALMASEVRRINDLSFYPEPFMVGDDVLSDAAGHGVANKDFIAKLAGVADLQLVPFEVALPRLERALQSPERWVRYWACISASAHGKAPENFVNLVEILAHEDTEPLVRARAAEFLALTGKADPKPIIKAALKMSDSEVATNLILNTAVLLQDGPTKIDFSDLTNADVNHGGRYVLDRVAYLSGKPKPAKKKRK